MANAPRIGRISDISLPGSLLIGCNIPQTKIRAQLAIGIARDASGDHKLRIDRAPELGCGSLIGIDLFSEGLHRRGYRLQGGTAPLRENLAAAILISAGWPALAREGGAFIDPMCGSGTLPLEAALMAYDLAPGLQRDADRFLHWRACPRDLWQELLAEAKARYHAAVGESPLMSATGTTITGFDIDERALRMARTNAQQAGLEQHVRFERRSGAELAALSGTKAASGLLVANPPHGHRMFSRDEVPCDTALATLLTLPAWRRWHAAVLACSEQSADMTEKPDWIAGLAINNGPLLCRVWHFGQGVPLPLPSRMPQREAVEHRPPLVQRLPAVAPSEELANRLRKNSKALRRWLHAEGVSCYRLYDSDMPEYAVAIDLYGQHAHVQEYQAPATVDPEHARYRLQQVVQTIPTVLPVSLEHVHVKVRAPQKGNQQYGKMAHAQTFLDVQEGGLKFLVNLVDYIDTGLFLDHRLIRTMIQTLAAGRAFLNLFGYTGTATVYAAAGGARRTTTVDLSRTYLDWAQRNMEINGFLDDRQQQKHTFIAADCLSWLDHSAERYDLIFLDPPTFSNSKRMQTPLDIQRDYGILIAKTVSLLDKGGILIFSSNYAKFKLDPLLLPDSLSVLDISKETSSPDFHRSMNKRHCWRMEKIK